MLIPSEPATACLLPCRLSVPLAAVCIVTVFPTYLRVTNQLLVLPVDTDAIRTCPDFPRRSHTPTTDVLGHEALKVELSRQMLLGAGDRNMSPFLRPELMFPTAPPAGGLSHGLTPTMPSPLLHQMVWLRSIVRRSIVRRSIVCRSIVRCRSLLERYMCS